MKDLRSARKEDIPEDFSNLVDLLIKWRNSRYETKMRNPTMTDEGISVDYPDERYKIFSRLWGEPFEKFIRYVKKEILVYSGTSSEEEFFLKMESEGIS